nr:reverse transcriptase domain-containing protein [Tanacetum cinerariifolium]
MEELIKRRVEKALAAYEAIHAANALEAESQSQNDSDGDNENGEISRVDYDVHQDGPRGGLPDNIQGNVIAAEPTRLQDVVRIANNLMDQKLKGYAVKNAKNKRRLEVNQRDNRGQQPPFKRQNVGGQNMARAYTASGNGKRGYAGPLPYCNKCKLNHEGPCTVLCGKCNKVGHIARDCKNAVVVLTTQRAPVVNQRLIRVKGIRPMRMSESASWVLGAIVHGRLGEGVGTVLVGEGVRDSCVGKERE